MTFAVTQTYRTVVAMAADLDMTIQIQEAHGWEFVTAFPAMIEADEQAHTGDTGGRAHHVIIFRQRHDRQRQAAFYS